MLKFIATALMGTVLAGSSAAKPIVTESTPITKSATNHADNFKVDGPFRFFFDAWNYAQFLEDIGYDTEIYQMDGAFYVISY